MFLNKNFGNPKSGVAKFDFEPIILLFVYIPALQEADKNGLFIEHKATKAHTCLDVRYALVAL